MASTTSRHLLFSFIITISAISTAARPCKTIFFITSSSSSSTQSDDPTATTNSPHITFSITQIRQFHRSVDSSSSSASSDDDNDNIVTSQTYYSSSVKTSIRDRTIDIMSIVGALFFGVGCGALTATSMYLIWSLFCTCDSDVEEEDYHDDEPHIRPDEVAYVDIPDTMKPIPPSAQEVEAMKLTNR